MIICYPMALFLVNVVVMGPKVLEISSRPPTVADHNLTLCDLTG